MPEGEGWDGLEGSGVWQGGFGLWCVPMACTACLLGPEGLLVAQSRLLNGLDLSIRYLMTTIFEIQYCTAPDAALSPPAQAVQQVFPGGHANVQSQGSAAKGTSLPQSDRDFFVRMDNTIPTATKNQRIAVRDGLVQQLEQKGIQYGRADLGQRRIHLCQGRSEPEVDVVFQRFKGDVRKEPNNRAMAGSHVGQQVTKHIKSMPGVYTNLPEPKQSSLVERHVKLVEEELHCQRGQGKLQGIPGFGQLLQASLEKLGGRQELTQRQRENLEQAGMVGNGWDHAANRDLNKMRLG